MLRDPAPVFGIRALTDCTVIRAKWNDPRYDWLRVRGLASASPVPGTDKADFRLTARGIIASHAVLP